MSAQASVRTFNPDAVATLSKKETRKLSRLGFVAGTPPIETPLPPSGGTGNVTESEDATVTPAEFTPVAAPESIVTPSVSPAEKVLAWIKSNPLLIGGVVVVVIIAFIASRK